MGREQTVYPFQIFLLGRNLATGHNLGREERAPESLTVLKVRIIIVRNQQSNYGVIHTFLRSQVAVFRSNAVPTRKQKFIFIPTRNYSLRLIFLSSQIVWRKKYSFHVSGHW